MSTFIPRFNSCAFDIISYPHAISNTAVPTDLNIVISLSFSLPIAGFRTKFPSSPLKSFLDINSLPRGSNISPASLRTPSLVSK